MADFNIELAKTSLGILQKDVFKTLKTPLGNEKYDKIDAAIENASKKLTVGLTDDQIKNILQELDLGIDGVKGNNISDDFSSFKFSEQLKTQLSSKLPSVSANLNLNWSLNSNVTVQGGAP
jgi:hypothetical protein